MIDFTKYENRHNSVGIIVPRSVPHHGTTTLADSGVVFFHHICDGVLYPEWIGVKFADIEGITLQTYHLGYIGL